MKAGIRQEEVTMSSSLQTETQLEDAAEVQVPGPVPDMVGICTRHLLQDSPKPGQNSTSQEDQ